MSKIYIQNTPVVWESSASIAAAASATSGSFITRGYARIVGIVTSSGSLSAACGVRVKQSTTACVGVAPQFDYSTDNTLTACGASAFSIEVIGQAGQIDIFVGADAADVFRAYWGLRPV